MHGKKLSLHAVKTQFLIVGSGSNVRRFQTQPAALPKFEINNDNIEIVSSFNYLGVQVDNQLKWDDHIEGKEKGTQSFWVGQIFKVPSFLRGPCTNVPRFGNCRRHKIDSLQKV